MPAAVIAILVLAVVGVGAYFLTTPESETEELAAPAPEEQSNKTASDSDEPASAPETNDEMADARTEDESPVEAAAEADEMTGDDTEATAAAAQPMTYSASASYLTPARDEHDVGVTLEVDADGIVTSADVSFNDGGGYSNSHHERFDQAYQSEVVGQPISDVELSSTGGASLTSEAFNEAVAEIRSQIG